MSRLAGTASLVRLALRRDRIVMPLWVAAFVLMAASSASAVHGLYPTMTSRLMAALDVNSSGALVALYGRIYDPTSLGALAMFKLTAFGAAMVGVASIVTVVRHTRSEEEHGRLELVGAAVVGRFAALTAALLVVAAADLVLGGLTAAGLAAEGLPIAGSLAFGLSWAAVGIAFAALAAAAAQLTGSARTATGVSLAVLGGAYLLRAMGDAAAAGGPRWLSWLSPVGWGQQVRAFAGERWWVLALLAAFALAAVVAAYVLAAHRDLGAGLVPDRPGPARASAALGGPFGLAWRLQRGAFVFWLACFVLLGAVLGSIATNVADFMDSPQARELFLRLGGQKGLIDAYLAAELGFTGVIASAFGIQAALRLHAEEDGGRLEPLLATATTRRRWAASHVVIALAGTAALLAAGGLAAGVTYSLQAGDSSLVWPVLQGALVQLPAACVLTGVAVALFGLAPRLSAAAWGVLAAFVMLGEIGPVLQLPQALLDLSPFAHTPKLPGSALAWTPLLWLTAVAVALLAAGLAGFRRRDAG